MNLARLFNTVCKLPELGELDLKHLHPKLRLKEIRSRAIVGHPSNNRLNDKWDSNWILYQQRYKR